MWLLRGLGLLVPVAFVIIGAFSGTLTDLMNQISVHMSFFLVGLIAGLLIRAWWSVALVPALLVGTIAAVAIARDDLAVRVGGEIETLAGAILLVVLNLKLPTMIGAAIGSLVSTFLGPGEYV